jgi:putative signal transducing protein
VKNLLRTQSIAWAQGVRVALEAEGVPAAILDEHDRGALGVLGQVRVAVLNDGDYVKAQQIVARFTPPRSLPPPSWRWQRRGLLVLGADVLLAAFWIARADTYQSEGTEPGILYYALGAVVGILFIIGMLFIILGPRADRAVKGAGGP